jgi:hypothetical protein
MQQPPGDHTRRDLLAPTEGSPPTTRASTPVSPLCQAGAVDSRATYYPYHLGQEVQQHHHRLFVTYVLATGRQEPPRGSVAAPLGS